MDRKYRQRGYMDSDRDRREKPKREPRPQGAKEFRPRQMPGFREMYRCSMCGSSIALEVGLETQCPKCKADLHTCKQCTFFDTSARFECTQPIPERVAPKNVRNECTFFAAKKSVERDTSSQTPGKAKPQTAREAFDALFKK
jgi:hypothetical protein